MIKVAGVWEQGWITPIQEYDLWTFPLRAFGVAEWYMAPVSGIDRRVTEIKDIQEALDNNLDLTPVYLDEEGSTLLSDFKHPQNALYLLGKAGYSPWRAHGKPNNSVRIETEADRGLLWPHQCICVALRDRMVKSWQ